MTFNLEQQINGSWRADLEDLPGTPPVGIGQTRELAIISLFSCLILEDKNYRWLEHIKHEQVKITYRSPSGQCFCK